MKSYKPHKVKPSFISYHYRIRWWIRRLRKRWCDLPAYRREIYLRKINNELSRDMHWRGVYNMDFDKDTGTITITGFPKNAYPYFFDINAAQVIWVLHRMGYNYANIYHYDKHAVKLELMDQNRENVEINHISMTPEEYCKTGCDNEYSNNDKNNGCNILENPDKNVEHHKKEHHDKDEHGVDYFDL